MVVVLGLLFVAYPLQENTEMASSEDKFVLALAGQKIEMYSKNISKYLYL